MASAPEKQYSKKSSRHPFKNIYFIITMIILSSASLFFGLTIGEYGYELQQFFSTVQPNSGEEPVNNTVLDQRLEQGLPFSVLLVGTDEREDATHRGLADTIIVATIHPQRNNFYLMSIPRDTLVTLPGTVNTKDKVNATYTYGGMPYMIEAVESLINIPIHSYAKISFTGLKDLVDAVGGVTVESDLEFSIKDDDTGEMQHIEKGIQHLNGAEALGYARMRKEDPQGDWGRQKRQREIIKVLVDELSGTGTFSNFTEILEAVSPSLEMNVSLEQSYTILRDYRPAANNMRSLDIRGESETVYFPHYGLNVYVYNPYPKSLGRLTRQFSHHLGLEDFDNRLNKNYDSLVTGFPLYRNNAVQELDLGDYVDEENLEQPQNNSEDNAPDDSSSTYENYEPYAQPNTEDPSSETIEDSTSQPNTEDFYSGAFEDSVYQAPPVIEEEPAVNPPYIYE